MNRRELTALLCTMGLGGLANLPAGAATPGSTPDEPVDSLSNDALAQIEASVGGRLGLSVMAGSKVVLGYRAFERFPMCSTFKVLAAGLVLHRVDRAEEHLDRVVRFTKADVVSYSPVTQDRIASGMTIAELCEAALTQSDNTAANLLLDSFGGPPGVTAWARSLGDLTTRLDRRETALNDATPGDPRDTTSPDAMANNLRKLLLGDVLGVASRQRLVDWMLRNRTGDERLRAGMPAGAIVADKTGSGEHGTANDIGLVWLPKSDPVVVTVYLTGTVVGGSLRNAAIADVGRTVTRFLSRAA
jgi:beta-lactamase class A